MEDVERRAQSCVHIFLGSFVTEFWEGDWKFHVNWRTGSEIES